MKRAAGYGARTQECIRVGRVGYQLGNVSRTPMVKEYIEAGRVDYTTLPIRSTLSISTRFTVPRFGHHIVCPMV